MHAQEGVGMREMSHGRCFLRPTVCGRANASTVSRHSPSTCMHTCIRPLSRNVWLGGSFLGCEKGTHSDYFLPGARRLDNLIFFCMISCNFHPWRHNLLWASCIPRPHVTFPCLFSYYKRVSKHLWSDLRHPKGAQLFVLTKSMKVLTLRFAVYKGALSWEPKYTEQQVGITMYITKSPGIGGVSESYLLLTLRFWSVCACARHIQKNRSSSLQFCIRLSPIVLDT